MKNPNIAKVKLDDLIPHEQFREEHKEELKQGLNEAQAQIRPIAVYPITIGRTTKYLIVDGHHRTQALREMGHKHVMANIIDYFDKEIKVLSWNGPDNDKEWDKNEIIGMALAGKLLEPKTTRHVIVSEGREDAFQDNDTVEPKVNSPLNGLL